MPLPPPPPPPPPPPAAPPPPPAFSAPPPKTKDRSALLQDIQKGRALKKVVTNDRSAPVVDGKSASSAASAHSRPGPGGGASTKFPAPAVPAGPTSFADELNRRLGGRALGKNSSNDGGCNATNGSTSTVINSNAQTPNGVSRPLPPPPPPSHSSSTPSLSKPVQSQGPKPPAASSKPAAPQPGRSGGSGANGVGRNVTKPNETPTEEDDGRFKGPSVKEQMRAFASANQPAQPPPPPPLSLKQRLSVEMNNGDYNDDGTYATKAAAPPPPPPSKPPSKLPHKDSRFHTLNPAKMNKQQGGAMVNIPRSGSHENLPGDGSQPPAPPPKLSHARSPGAASRPAPPPPGRPPPPDRPQVAPPPPPPTAPPPPMVQKAQNGRHNAYTAKNPNEPILRNAFVDNSPAPPPRRESLMPDLERRFTFLALHEIPPPEDFRSVPKNYGRQLQPQQQRSRAPEPPTHR